MGVHTDGGFGVLNMTNFKITCGLSMGATHYYENDVLPGQIFYRWPGAVWYTVYCLPTTDSTRMTDGKCAKEIITVTASAVGAGAAAIASLFAGGAFLPAAWSLAALTTVGGATGLALSLGVGAAFDFHSGRKKQAPAWMQRSGLEWLFRLVQEPRRLGRRYVVYNSQFLYLLARKALRRGGA